MEEKQIDSLISPFDSASKDVSTVSNCLLKSSSSHNWNDIVYESTNNLIYELEQDFRQDVAFLDLEALISRGKEILGVNVDEIQENARAAIKEADMAMAWKGGKFNDSKL